MAPDTMVVGLALKGWLARGKGTDMGNCIRIVMHRCAVPATAGTSSSASCAAPGPRTIAAACPESRCRVPYAGSHPATWSALTCEVRAP